MSENNENNVNNESEFSVNKEELKNETKETVNQVKDTIKNVKFKEDSVATKNFVIEIFKNPCEKLKEIVEDNSGKFLKFSILILALYVILSALDEFIIVSSYGAWADAGYRIQLVIREILYPVIRVLVPTFVILILNKKNKKSLTTILSAVITTKIPVVVGVVVGLINHIRLADISYITNPVGTVLTAISYIMMYFAIKFIYDEEDNSKAIKTFAKIWLITSVVLSVVSLVFNKLLFK